MTNYISEDMKQRIIDAAHRAVEREHEDDDCIDRTEVESQVLLGLLKIIDEQKVRELTMEEWRKWKTNPKRDPICMLWENDTSPMWIFKPEDVHEPALLMGKLKLFTGKPTFEQCKVVKWK